MLPNKDPIDGVKRSAYIREPPRTAKTVTIKVRKKEPDKESQNNKGKKDWKYNKKKTTKSCKNKFNCIVGVDPRFAATSSGKGKDGRDGSDGIDGRDGREAKERIQDFITRETNNIKEKYIAPYTQRNTCRVGFCSNYGSPIQ